MVGIDDFCLWTGGIMKERKQRKVGRSFSEGVGVQGSMRCNGGVEQTLNRLFCEVTVMKSKKGGYGVFSAYNVCAL